VDQCSNPNGADVLGQVTITAANGDTIFGHYKTLAQLDFAAGEVTALGRWEIDGGTGRFAGASGRGVIGAQGSLLPPFAVTGGMAGAIAY
jgi:hypothetical protein